jgi:transcriptional regulator with XRE-family HTH domain
MRVDAKRIRAERERRAWSQEHLAIVSGLGLRTIQRIEKTGAASFESARALAAVLEIAVAELRVPRDESGPSEIASPSSVRVEIDRVAAPPARAAGRFRLGSRPVLGGAAAVLTAAGALFVATKGFADVVQLDVDVAVNDQVVETSQLVTEANDNVALRAADDKLRMVIVPTIESNGIMLATEIYVLDGSDYVLASSPKLLTTDGKEAEIRLTTKGGDSFRFSITPHQNPPRVPPVLKEW